MLFTPSGRPRARALGIPFDGEPGPLNAITDVPGVEVGYVTLVAGDAVRTGVTAVLPRGRGGIGAACPAGWYSLNGNGEMTGTTWISETGGLSTPVMLTNTSAVGPVHRGVIDWTRDRRPDLSALWNLPVVAETWDGYLNDIHGDHVRARHAVAAIDAARTGAIEEGSVGGGTGMNSFGFKGGSGTASRRVRFAGRTHTVGAFVQANFGAREELRIAGVSMGDLAVPDPIGAGDWLLADLAAAGVPIDPGGRASPAGAGSIIALIATDAPMLPVQCAALARRVPLGLARTGTTGGHFSGDIFLAWSTGGAGAAPGTGALDSRMPLGLPGEQRYESLRFVPWGQIDPFLVAVVQCVEEAVLNAMVVATAMTGRNGNVSPALPHAQVVDRLRAAGVLAGDRRDVPAARAARPTDLLS